MAKQSLATIKSWFKRGAKPTAAQFASVFDSFFHKDESIPQSNISELGTTITALETLISKNKQITIQQEYDGLVNKDSGTVYFCADTGNLYLGQVPLFEPDAFTSATLGNDGIVTFTRHGNGTSTTFTLDMNPLLQNISDMEALIPNQATPQNQLADKDFVNSSISTNTADYKGLVIASDSTETAAQTALSSISGMNNNDYAFVKVSDTPQVGVDTYKRYKYDGSAWMYEYTLNNSSFTAAQWAAINAGITVQKVTDYDGHLSDTNNPHGVTKAQVGLGNVDNTSDADKPISTAQQAALIQKQDVLNVGNNIKINNNTISALYDLVCEPTGTTMNTRIGKFTQGEYLVAITAEGRQGGNHKSAIAFVHISNDGTITNNEINYLGDLKLMGMYNDGNANYIVVDTDGGTFRYSAQIIVIRRTAATAFEAEMSRTTNGGQASVLKKEFNLNHLLTSNGTAEITLSETTGLVSIRSTASGVEIISTGGQVVLDGGSAGVLVNSMLRIVGTTYFTSNVYFSGNLTFGGNAFNSVKETAMHTSASSQGMPTELVPNEFVQITAPLSAFAPTCVGAVNGKANEYYGRFEAGANIIPAGTDNGVAITWYGNAVENGGIYEFSILEGVGIITRLN